MTDKIVAIVRDTPVRGFNPFNITVNQVGMVEEKLKNSAEYKSLISAMTIMHSDALKTGGSPELVNGAILSIHEEMLRFSIMTEIRNTLSHVGADDMEALKLSWLHVDLSDKIKKAGEELLNLETKAKALVSDKPVDQFKYSLLYAANKWGNQKEIKAVESLTAKIKLD